MFSHHFDRQTDDKLRTADIVILKNLLKKDLIEKKMKVDERLLN